MDLRELPTAPFVRHPWEVARARFFCRVVAESVPHGARLRVLDVGAGDGYLAAELARQLPGGSAVVCLDPHYTDEQIAAFGARAEGQIVFTRTAFDQKFELLLLLDVIEHVRDDAEFLTRLVAEHLDSGGLALISVPAFQALFTEHDVALGHFRRYRRRQLEDVLARSGLDPVGGGSLFASLLAPRFAAKLLELARGIRSLPDGTPPDHATTDAATFRAGKLAGEAVAWVLDQDAKLGRALTRRGVVLPGLSVWALGRKP